MCEPFAAIDTPLALIWPAVLFTTAGSEPFTVPPLVVTDQLFKVTPVVGNPGVSVSVYVPAVWPPFATVIRYCAVYVLPLTFAMLGAPLVTVIDAGVFTCSVAVAGAALLPLFVCKAPAAIVFSAAPAVLLVTFAVIVQVPGVPPGIVAPEA